MHSVALLGFMLANIMLINHTNGLPIESETQIVTMTDEQKFRKSLANLSNDVETVKHVNSTSEPVAQNKVKVSKQSGEPQKVKSQIKRRKGHRRAYLRIPDCKGQEVPAPKPTQNYVQLPNMFISQGWGPGR